MSNFQYQLIYHNNNMMNELACGVDHASAEERLGWVAELRKIYK